MDITGFRSEYQLEFRFLDRDEFAWLELLHTRMVPGPHWMIDPLKKNRLSVAACRLVVTPYGKTGVRPPVGASIGASPVFPSSGIDFRGHSAYVWNWTDQNPRVQFDAGRYIPLLPSESITGSVYLQSSIGNITGSTLRFDWFDRYGEPLSGTPSSSSSSFNLTANTWVRQSFTASAPAGAAACRFSIVVGTLSDPDDTILAFAAPQVESGTQATDFEVGCASPEVLIEQLETESPRFPYRNVTLTILEA